MSWNVELTGTRDEILTGLADKGRYVPSEVQEFIAKAFPSPDLPKDWTGNEQIFYVKGSGHSEVTKFSYGSLEWRVISKGGTRKGD